MVRSGTTISWSPWGHRTLARAWRGHKDYIGEMWRGQEPSQGVAARGGGEVPPAESPQNTHYPITHSLKIDPLPITHRHPPLDFLPHAVLAFLSSLLKEKIEYKKEPGYHLLLPTSFWVYDVCWISKIQEYVAIGCQSGSGLRRAPPQGAVRL